MSNYKKRSTIIILLSISLGLLLSLIANILAEFVQVGWTIAFTVLTCLSFLKLGASLKEYKNK